jgi:VanZ family protein
VQRSQKFIIGYLPVLIWMCVIFSASGDRASFHHSSRIIAPLFLWLFPNASPHAVHSAVFFVRKCAHLTEYAILALLLLRALQLSANRETLWHLPHARLALLIVALYAASDEFHQRFVPSREASAWDVLIDTTGAAIALFLVWAFTRLRQKYSSK